MKKFHQSLSKSLKVIALTVVLSMMCSSAAFATAIIGIPNDTTNCARSLKLLEKAGLITVDPAVGYSPELKDITGYIYDIEIMPVAANTLPSTLDDFTASMINGTYAIPAGLISSRDGLIVEKQEEGDDNPFVNVIVARTADKDNPIYKKVVEAYQTQDVAQFVLLNRPGSSYPSFPYNPDFTVPDDFLEKVIEYRSDKKDKVVVRLGVCGASHDTWNAAQRYLDEQGAGIYLDVVEFDAYNLPNEALDNGEIDLNAFQHVAYLNKEISARGYDLTPIGNTSISPIALYSYKVKSLDELKELAGKK